MEEKAGGRCSPHLTQHLWERIPWRQLQDHACLSPGLQLHVAFGRLQPASAMALAASALFPTAEGAEEAFQPALLPFSRCRLRVRAEHSELNTQQGFFAVVFLLREECFSDQRCGMTQSHFRKEHLGTNHPVQSINRVHPISLPTGEKYLKHPLQSLSLWLSLTCEVASNQERKKPSKPCIY